MPLAGALRRETVLGRNALPTGANKVSLQYSWGKGWRLRRHGQLAWRRCCPCRSRRGGLGAAAASGGHHVCWAGAVGDGAQQVQAGHQAEEVRQQCVGGGLRGGRVVVGGWVGVVGVDGGTGWRVVVGSRQPLPAASRSTVPSGKCHTVPVTDHAPAAQPRAQGRNQHLSPGCPRLAPAR